MDVMSSTDDRHMCDSPKKKGQWWVPAPCRGLCGIAYESELSPSQEMEETSLKPALAKGKYWLRS